MIPTIEQVREHAESSGCGLWLLRWHGYPPELRVLRASGKHVEYWSVSIGAWIPAFVHSHPESAIPCDQAGSPLPLVEERSMFASKVRAYELSIPVLEAKAAGMDALREKIDCGQDGVCIYSPGCNRHWEERNRELVQEMEASRWVAAEQIAAAHKERDAWQHRVVQAEARLSVVLGLPNCTLEQACAALEKAAANDREAYL